MLQRFSISSCVALFLVAGTACSAAPAVATRSEPMSAPMADLRVQRGAGNEAGGGFGVDGPIAGQGDADAVTTPQIARTARLALEVDAYEPFRSALDAWLIDHGGHVADESVSRYDGRTSYATVSVRVPTDALDPALGWLQEAGQVQQIESHQTDVTAEAVDLDARLGALKTTEGRLLELTSDRTATLADVLAAETELSRVRGQIESLTGQRKVLAQRVALATVDLSVSVRTPFVASGHASLGTEVGRAFAGSIRTMGQVGRATLITGVAAAPWLVVLAGIGAGGVALTAGAIGGLSRIGRRKR